MSQFLRTRSVTTTIRLLNQHRRISGSAIVEPRIGPLPTLPLGNPATAPSKQASDLSGKSTALLSSQHEDILRKLSTADYSMNSEDVDRAFGCIDEFGLPAGTSVLALRASMLHFARKLQPSTIITCLQLFAEERIADHNFFKEMGKVLLSKSEDLTVSQISGLLKSHAAIGATETDLFSVVCSRLSSVINRASIHMVREILTSLSYLGSLADPLRMVELCLNRYSLCAKDDLSVEIDRDVLLAIARLRIPNSRVIRMTSAKIVSKSDRLDAESFVKVLGSLSVLNADPSAIWRSAKRRYFADLSPHPTSLLSDLAIAIGSLDMEFSVKAAAVCGLRNPGIGFADSVCALKHALNLTVLNLTENDSFEAVLRKHSVEELRAIQKLLKLPKETVELKPPTGTYLKCRTWEFTRVNVAGLFTTQLMQSAPKKMQTKSKGAKKIHM